MSKKMVTTQPGLFLFTDKDSAFQVTEVMRVTVEWLREGHDEV